MPAVGDRFTYNNIKDGRAVRLYGEVTKLVPQPPQAEFDALAVVKDSEYGGTSPVTVVTEIRSAHLLRRLFRAVQMAKGPLQQPSCSRLVLVTLPLR